MQADIDSYGSEHHINWIEPLAYLGAKYGGNFSSYKKKDLASILEKLKNGENMDGLAKDMNTTLLLSGLFDCFGAAF